MMRKKKKKKKKQGLTLMRYSTTLSAMGPRILVDGARPRRGMCLATRLSTMHPTVYILLS
jgi:hypothetical protein